MHPGRIWLIRLIILHRSNSSRRADLIIVATTKTTYLAFNPLQRRPTFSWEKTLPLTSNFWSENNNWWRWPSSQAEVALSKSMGTPCERIIKLELAIRRSIIRGRSIIIVRPRTVIIITTYRWYLSNTWDHKIAAIMVQFDISQFYIA